MYRHKQKMAEVQSKFGWEFAIWGSEREFDLELEPVFMA